MSSTILSKKLEAKSYKQFLILSKENELREYTGEDERYGNATRHIEKGAVLAT